MYSLLAKNNFGKFLLFFSGAKALQWLLWSTSLVSLTTHLKTTQKFNLTEYSATQSFYPNSKGFQVWWNRSGKETKRVLRSREMDFQPCWEHLPMPPCSSAYPAQPPGTWLKTSTKLKSRCRVSFHRTTPTEINARIYRNSSWTQGKQVVISPWRWCRGIWKWSHQKKAVQAHKLSSSLALWGLHCAGMSRGNKGGQSSLI